MYASSREERTSVQHTQAMSKGVLVLFVPIIEESELLQPKQLLFDRRDVFV